MKHLSKQDLSRVVRELDESPAVVRWIAESLDENRDALEACESMESFRIFQGKCAELRQILDKVPVPD